MYAVFSLTPSLAKRRAFNGAAFHSIEDAERFVKDIAICFERDPDGHDAADFFASDGQVYCVERIDPNPGKAASPK